MGWRGSKNNMRSEVKLNLHLLHQLNVKWSHSDSGALTETNVLLIQRLWSDLLQIVWWEFKEQHLFTFQKICRICLDLEDSVKAQRGQRAAYGKCHGVALQAAVQ